MSINIHACTSKQMPLRANAGLGATAAPRIGKPSSSPSVAPSTNASSSPNASATAAPSSNNPGVPIIVQEAAPPEPFLEQFATSPGLAGLLAVLAAAIAGRIAYLQYRHNKDKADNDRWWDTLTWVYDRTVVENEKQAPLPQEVTFSVLTALHTQAADGDADLPKLETIKSIAGMFDTSPLDDEATGNTVPTGPNVPAPGTTVPEAAPRTPMPDHDALGQQPAEAAPQEQPVTPNAYEETRASPATTNEPPRTEEPAPREAAQSSAHHRRNLGASMPPERIKVGSETAARILDHLRDEIGAQSYQRATNYERAMIDTFRRLDYEIVDQLTDYADVVLRQGRKRLAIELKHTTGPVSAQMISRWLRTAVSRAQTRKDVGGLLVVTNHPISDQVSEWLTRQNLPITVTSAIWESPAHDAPLMKVVDETFMKMRR